jgi:hypothetical protein
MSDYFSHDIKLQPGTKARAEDVNARFDGVVIGFDKLPAAHPSLPGFSAAVAVGDPTDKAHAVTAGQAMSGGLTYAVDTGIVNAFVVDLQIAPLSYSDGLRVAFKALNSNTGAATININGLGIKQLVRSNGDALATGDIISGQVVSLIYNGSKFYGITPFQGQLNEIVTLTSGYSVAAAGSASSASGSAGTATTKASEANLSAVSASSSAGTATTQAGIATTKAGEASTSATNASNSAIATAADRVQTGLDRVATAADRVQTGLDRAQVNTDKNTATTQAGIATTQAGTATTQAGNASTSAGTATTQAGIATTQAGIATTKAAEAAASAAEALAGGGGGGVEWSVETTNKTTESGKAYLMDTSSSAKTVTLHGSPVVGDTIAVGDYAGTFGTYACTIARNSMLINSVAADLVLNANGEVMTLVYSGATKGWVTVGTVTADYPKSVLNKPFFHCQDQKAYNVDGGTSIADAWTKRTLNTVIYNDIQGAELTGGLDGVSLPAGTYYVEASQRLVANTTAALLPGIFVNNTLAVQDVGETTQTSYSTGGSVVRISGVVTLLTPGVIDLRYYVGVAEATTGLGVKNSTGSIADTSLPSIYADLKIWQLDRSLEIAPKAINSGLQTIAGMNTEGNIMGFDVTVSGNTLTISKGSCMSSDLTVPLAFTADKTCVLPGTVNGDFYVFAVRLLDGVTYEARAYSTYVGPSSDAQIDKWRFISFAKNNGSGVTMPFKQVNDRIDWTLTQNRPILTASLTTSSALYNISAIIPTTLASKITLASTEITVHYTHIAYTYTTTESQYRTSNAIPTAEIVSVSTIYARYVTGNTYLHIQGIMLRR